MYVPGSLVPRLYHVQANTIILGTRLCGWDKQPAMHGTGTIQADMEWNGD